MYLNDRLVPCAVSQNPLLLCKDDSTNKIFAIALKNECRDALKRGKKRVSDADEV